MPKFKKRKCKIKLNEVLNERLDSMEDNSSLEVFEPKSSMQMDFFNLINEAVEKEENLEEEKQNIKRKRQGKRNSQIKSVTTDEMQSKSLSVVLILCFLFLLFVFIVWKIIF